LASQLEVLTSRAEELGHVAADRPEGRRAERLAERLAARRYVISVVGEFKRGKSTLINALLGEETLPAGVLPLTAIATELSFGEPAAVVEYLDGNRSTIAPGDIADFVTEARNPANARSVARVERRGRWPLLSAGVVLIDTPGIGSVHEHNTQAARAALLDADGAVLVLSADAPLSEQERDLLRSLAERRAPTFFVLNKIDHLRSDELDEVRRFVEDVLCDELGRKPPVFPLAARPALEATTAGRPPGADSGAFSEFVAEIERFIKEDLVEARLVAARRELARLGSSLSDALMVETAASEFDADTLASKVAEFRSAAAAQRRAFEDERVLLARDVARLSEGIGRRLNEFARSEAARHRDRLAEVAATAPRSKLVSTLRATIESTVRKSFETFRAAEVVHAEATWQELAAGFRSKTQARVDVVRAAAGELFSLSLPPLAVPVVAEQREQFFYLFLHVGSFSDPFSGALRRLLPSSVARRRAARWADAELARELDKHAGRARWDLTQRLDAVRQRFEVTMRGELDACVDGILDAADRAEQLRRAGVDERDRHAASIENMRSLAATLAALADVE
jgi:GTP-binding protein EngB required for normal cell division